MNLKKNKNADLEKSKTLFVESGLVIALLAALFIIESNFASTKTSKNSQISEIEIELSYTPNREKKETKPQKPKPQLATSLIVVNDNMQIEDSLTEANFDFEIDFSEIEKALPEKKETKTDFVYIYVEKMPEFPGGRDGLNQYIKKNMRYPRIAMENDIQGKIYTSFEIDKTGKVQKLRLLNSLSPELDNEARRLITQMPPWTAGSQNGKAVSVQYSMPVTFVIQ